MNLYKRILKVRTEKATPGAVEASKYPKSHRLLNHRWLWPVTEYVCWNVMNYTIGQDTDEYYKVYYVGERLFVVLCFYALIPGVHKQYQWILKILLAVSVFKLIYILLYTANMIPINRGFDVGLLGSIFIIAIGIITLKWGKA